MKLRCYKCYWEKEIERREPLDCPNCGPKSVVVVVHDHPLCRVCGKKTRATGGSSLGGTWDCPDGHYRESFNKYSGRSCKIDGKIIKLRDCERCWRTIPLERLDSSPDIKFCLECSEEITNEGNA